MPGGGYTVTTEPTERAWQTAFESMGDTPFPVIVDERGAVVAVVLGYGAPGEQQAERIAEALRQ